MWLLRLVIMERQLCLFCFFFFSKVGYKPMFQKKIVILQCFIVFICELIYLTEHCTDVFTCCIACFLFLLLYTKMLVAKHCLKAIKKNVTTMRFHYFLHWRGLFEVFFDVDEWLAKVDLELCAAEVVVQLLPPFLRGMFLVVDESCPLSFVEQSAHNLVLFSAEACHMPWQLVSSRVHELAQD